jgi:L-lactate dehydrogenase
VRGIALSLPTLVSAAGAVQVMTPGMDAAEREALAASGAALDRAFMSLSGS